MKGCLLVYLLVAAMLLPASAHAKDSCDTDAQKRVVIGPQPTANTLYAHIQHVDMGSWPSGFDSETFIYIGEVHAKSGKTYKIGHLQTIWGLSCRGTQRLLIFDSDNDYLGQYAPIMVDAKHIRIQGSVVIFPFDPKHGDKLDLSDGPPATAWLDGDDLDWSPAPSPSAGATSH